LRAINWHRRPGNAGELQNRVKTDTQHGRQQKDNRQRLELTSQPAVSTTLNEAREKIETELVQQALKKHLGGSAQPSPTPALSLLAFAT